MNILCEFSVPVKGKEKKCKLTMRSIIQAQTAMGFKGLKDLGEALEALDLATVYMLIKFCIDEDVEVLDLYDEDINAVHLAMTFLAAILELFDTEKKTAPSKKKKLKK